MRLLTILFATAMLFSTAAFAGKNRKMEEMRSAYSYVINQVGRTSAKGKKAKAIMRDVRRAYKTMDRGAFYSFTAKKDAQLTALAN